VADKEGEELDFGELNLPDDDLAKDDSLEDDLALMGEVGVPEVSDDAEVAPLGDDDAETASFGDAEDLPVLDSDEAAADQEALDESDADESEEEEEERPGFLAKLREASPFTVMLGLSLVAILIAILCLLAQLKEYDYQTKPGSAGLPAATAISSRLASLDTTNLQTPNRP